MALMGKWIVENASGMFGEFRAQKPIFITPGPVIVSRYRDVFEVASLGIYLATEGAAEEQRRKVWMRPPRPRRLMALH